MYSMGSAELVLFVFALLPGLLGVAIGLWLVMTVMTQGRRIAHLEERLHALERRGHA